MFHMKNSNKKTKLEGKLFVWILSAIVIATIAVADVESVKQEPLYAADVGTERVSEPVSSSDGDIESDGGIK